MANKKIEVGNIVRVKGNSINMTVNSINVIECLYFDNEDKGYLHREYIEKSTLEIVSE